MTSARHPLLWASVTTRTGCSSTSRPGTPPQTNAGRKRLHSPVEWQGLGQMAGVGIGRVCAVRRLTCVYLPLELGRGFGLGHLSQYAGHHVIQSFPHERLPALTRRGCSLEVSMAFTNPNKMVNAPPALSVEGAQEYARKLVELEAKGADTSAALKRIERRYGLRATTIEHLRHRRAKSVDVGLFARLRGAYLDACERMAAKLLSEIETVKLGAPNDLDEALSLNLRVLADQVACIRQQVGEARAQRLSEPDGQKEPGQGAQDGA